MNRPEKNKRFLKGILVLFLSLLILFASGFAAFLYAPIQPFKDLRALWITTAMTSMSHKYLATWFFSPEEINQVMGLNRMIEPAVNTDEKEINTTETKAKPDTLELIDISTSRFKGYLLKVNNPARVKVASTAYLGKVGQRAEDIAKRYGASVVINGGIFHDPNGTGNGGQPLGILIEDGKILYKDNTPRYDIIGLDQNNVLVLGNYTLDQIKAMNIRDAVTFHPFLVVNGIPSVTEGNGGRGIAPRTAIGQTKDGTIFMLVIDGRQVNSIGATLKDVQDIMLKYGVYNVANLDGGSSTILYYNGKIMNNPSSKFGERTAPSFFIVK